MIPAQQKGIAFIVFHLRVAAVVMEKYEYFFIYFYLLSNEKLVS